MSSESSQSTLAPRTASLGNTGNSLAFLTVHANTQSNVEEKIKIAKEKVANRRLHIAAGEGNEDDLKCLINENCNIDFYDEDGNTPLNYAIRGGHGGAVKLLLEKGARIDVENKATITPYEMALALDEDHLPENEKIVHILREHILRECFKIIAAGNDFIFQDEMRSAASCDDKNADGTEQNSVLKKELDEKNLAIDCLTQRLAKLSEQPMGTFSYEHANVYILFLEVFAFHNMNKETQKQVMEKIGISKKSHDTIVDTRQLLLKCNKDNDNNVDLAAVKKIMESCHVLEKGEAEEFLTTDLKHYLEGTTSREFPDITRCSEIEFRNSLKKPKSKSVKKYENLKKLVLQAYQKVESPAKLWFQFIVQIYPTLGLENSGDNIGEIEKCLRHLRNNLVHRFYEYGPFEFCEAIINLRGPIFEYYYALVISEKLCSLLTGSDVTQLTKFFPEDLKLMQDAFKDADLENLSEQEGKDMFGYRIVSSLFPKQSDDYGNTSLEKLVKDYFMCMCVIEDVRPDEEEDSFEEVRYSAKLLTPTEFERRMLFERFVKLKRLYQLSRGNDSVYNRERDVLFKELKIYGVTLEKFVVVCNSYVEGKDVSEIIDQKSMDVVNSVVEFINGLKDLCNVDKEYHKEGVLSMGKLILEEGKNVKPLVLAKRNTLQKMLEDKRTNIQIANVIALKCKFEEISLKFGKVILKVEVGKAVGNILGTFYNAYDCYKIDFGMDIFYKETFVDELVSMVVKRMKRVLSNGQSEAGENHTLQLACFFMIDNIVDIEYMAPFLVKLLRYAVTATESKSILTSGSSLKKIDKLISNLLNGKDAPKYLNFLLKLSFSQELYVYQQICKNILQNHVDIFSIGSLFSDVVNLCKFADALINLFRNEENDKERICSTTMNFLKLVNEEAAQRLYSASSEREHIQDALGILKKGDDLEVLLRCDDAASTELIVRSVLKAKVQNVLQNHDDALEILTEAESRTEDKSSCYRFLIICEKAYTEALSGKHSESKATYTALYCDIMNYLLKKSADDPSAVKMNDGIYRRYNQIKDLVRYKSLLQSSELLQSHKHLDVLRIARNVEIQKSKIIDKTELPGMLTISKEIYSCIRNEQRDKLGYLYNFVLCRLYFKLGEWYLKESDQSLLALHCLTLNLERLLYIGYSSKQQFDTDTLKNFVLIAILNCVPSEKIWWKTRRFHVDGRRGIHVDDPRDIHVDMVHESTNFRRKYEMVPVHFVI